MKRIFEITYTLRGVHHCELSGGFSSMSAIKALLAKFSNRDRSFFKLQSVRMTQVEFS